MTDSVDHPPAPMPTLPPDELDFEVETETMADGRQIHFYRWPEPEPAADDV